MITAQDRADIEQAIQHMDAQAATRMTDLDRRCLAYRGRFGEPPCLWLLGDREAALTAIQAALATGVPIKYPDLPAAY
jgi:hypothetical protein